MNGFVFVRYKNVITGPFPRHRVREMLERGVLGEDTEVSEDKLQWELLVPAAEAPPLAHLVPDAVSSDTLPSTDEGMERSPNEIRSCPDLSEPKVTLEQPVMRRNERTGVQDERSHLWPFCHLVCAMTAWPHHAKPLEHRVTAAAWMAVLYCFLVTLGPLAWFGPAYPAWRGYLWGGAFAGVAMAVATIFAFLVVAIANHLPTEPAPRCACTAATMTLLMEFATLFGTTEALLHGVCHPRPWEKLLAWGALTLVVALFAAGCRQLITGFAAPSEASIRRRGALRVWGLWMILILFEISFFALFSLGML